MICARLNNVDTILEELRRVYACLVKLINTYYILILFVPRYRKRLSNSKEQETLIGIEEVKKISRLRAEDLIQVDPQVSKL